ncbi:MAG: ATP-dependent sacrificial sulfur transferase LarE [Candidatus Aminicenantes bacterium]|nr:MAG: ATP-dependent sacrificial sulfur transferase LarE [Candidatus Aminicenantes bacterium]
MTSDSISDETQQKFKNLKDILKSMNKVLVAFSGGVDSTFLLKVAQDVLGSNVMAVIASSATYPEREQQEALRIAEDLNVKYKVINTKELDDPSFRDNPPERCYFCKKELFSRLKEIAAEENIPHVCDGSNFEDTFDFRPGAQAAQELDVRSPLKEARLGKSEIRVLSKKLGLPTWDKPAMACLSSRFPYYTPIDDESLRQIDSAEEFLRSKGFSQLRVRHHGQMARIEIDPSDFSVIMDEQTRIEIVENLKKIGYHYVTLDLAGYRTGSMNEPILEGSSSSPKKNQ